MLTAEPQPMCCTPPLSQRLAALVGLGCNLGPSWRFYPICLTTPKLRRLLAWPEPAKYHAGRAPAGSQNPYIFQELSDKMNYVKGHNQDEVETIRSFPLSPKSCLLTPRKGVCFEFKKLIPSARFVNFES